MRKIILVFYLFISLNTVAKDNKNYLELINSAEKLLYNFNFDSCLTIINRTIDNHPQKPDAFLIKAKIHLWHYLGSKDQIDFDMFFRLSDSVLVKTEQLISNDENNPKLIYLLGNVYKYRAMAYGSNGNTLDAFWATKKSVSFFEDVLDLDSLFYSAYGGIGIFEYALGYVPAFYNWAISLSGLSADKQNGFNFIKKASELGSLDRIEYKFHLSKLYDEHLAEYEESVSVLSKLIDEYPENILFRYQAAIEFIKLHQLDNAVDELNFVLNVNNPKFSQTNSFANFLMGDILFRKRNYQKAVEYYLLFLKSTNTIDYTGIASLRTSYCYYFLGQIKEFRKYAILASNGNLDLEDDKYAKDMGLYILGNGFSNENKVLIEVENCYLAGNYYEMLEIIESNTDSLNSESIIAQIKLYKSIVLIHQKNLVESENILKSINEINLDPAKWVEAMRLFYLAKIYYHQDDQSRASEYLEYAEDNNDYQKENLISSYINGLRRKINYGH